MRRAARLSACERKIALARKIANLTSQEREILSYLVTRNEQVFMGAHSPQKAATLVTPNGPRLSCG